MPKLKETFTKDSIMCHRHERLAVLEMFTQSFCFQQVKALEGLGRNCLTMGGKEAAARKRRSL